jgi:hypothetical protein
MSGPTVKFWFHRLYTSHCRYRAVSFSPSGVNAVFGNSRGGGGWAFWVLVQKKWTACRQNQGHENRKPPLWQSVAVLNWVVFIREMRRLSLKEIASTKCNRQAGRLVWFRKNYFVTNKQMPPWSRYTYRQTTRRSIPEDSHRHISICSSIHLSRFYLIKQL